jgi:signal transduction histidine kinase
MFDAKGGIRNVRIIDAAGRTWLDQGPGYAIPAAELPLGQGHSHRLWRGIDVAAYPIQSGGHRAWMVISSDRRRPESLVANVAATFLHRFLWIVPALIFGSLVLTLLFLAHATRAIRKASRRADGIDARSLDLRLDEEALPLEVQPLARAMNRALDRVEHSYSAQAEFAGNVAHELRNPLATIGCQIEQVSNRPLRARMSASLRHAAHVIDQLMMLARVGGEETPLHAIDLRAVTLAALEECAPRIIANGRTIEFEDASPETGFAVNGNQGLARLALDNLIDNAERHTPPGTCIRVTLGPSPCLLVEDDGPGIAAADRQRVQERHWRADAARADGAGLGLSIVSRAMRAQDGSLEICESSGGAKVALNFVVANPSWVASPQTLNDEQSAKQADATSQGAALRAIGVLDLVS